MEAGNSTCEGQAYQRLVQTMSNINIPRRTYLTDRKRYHAFVRGREHYTDNPIVDSNPGPGWTFIVFEVFKHEWKYLHALFIKRTDCVAVCYHTDEEVKESWDL